MLIKLILSYVYFVLPPPNIVGKNILNDNIIKNIFKYNKIL